MGAGAVRGFGVELGAFLGRTGFKVLEKGFGVDLEGVRECSKNVERGMVRGGTCLARGMPAVEEYLNGYQSFVCRNRRQKTLKRN